MRRRISAMVGCAALIFGLGAVAAPHEEQATVLLSSGERVRGEFLDMHGGYIVLQTDRSYPIQLPVRDVVLIDFEGDARYISGHEMQHARAAGPVVVLHDGTSIDARWLEAERSGESGPVWFSLQTDRGYERQFLARDVSRIYLGDMHGAVGRTTFDEPTPFNGPAGQDRTITVPANESWISTGIMVERGDHVSFDARGRIRLSGDPDDIATPAGSLRRRLADDAPLPETLAGALIGRVGESEPFGIGNQRHPLPMPASGLLVLGINDDALWDNVGEFRVTINQHDGGRQYR